MSSGPEKGNCPVYGTQGHQYINYVCACGDELRPLPKPDPK